LAYPFLFLPLYLILDETTKDAVRDFITIAFLYQVVLGVIIGAVFGYVFSKVMKFMESLGYIGSESYVVQYVALALLVEGFVTLFGNDDLLASFAAGRASMITFVRGGSTLNDLDSQELRFHGMDTSQSTLRKMRCSPAWSKVRPPLCSSVFSYTKNYLP
jgi:NhaP-type Na+/H+ or K+/H+ antiporter